MDGSMNVDLAEVTMIGSVFPITVRKMRTLKRGAARPVSSAHLEIVELLNCLDNLVGVGSVDLEMPRRPAAGMEAPDDWLWLEPAGKPPESAVPLKELCKLGILRCTYRMISYNTARVRIYALPDDVGRKTISRSSPAIRKHMKTVLDIVDVSKRGWRGLRVSKGERKSLIQLDPERSSLFYLFNTIKSPQPDPDALHIKDAEVQYLLKSVLSGRKPIPGMKSTPYEYQRKSMAMMLQRELAPGQTLDSRLRETFAPTGEVYYIDLDTLQIYQDPSYFDDVRGGILAEEMGTGKTLICLGVILATKNQYAAVPEEHSIVQAPRDGVPSLMELCVSYIWKNNIAWRDYVSSDFQRCTRLLEENHGFYEIPPAVKSRSSRLVNSSAKERIFLGSGTIIVCPPNLVGQWRSEITKHVEPGVLKVLVLEYANSEIPAVSELLKYDVVIFSRTRFDAEDREGKDALGRMEAGGTPLKCWCPYIGASRVPDCRCFQKDGIYQSPLLRIRWKRIIVDEGHSMGSTKTRAASLVNKLPVERRWIVSGTPSSGLLGAGAGVTAGEGETKEEVEAKKDKLLEDRKYFRESEEEDLERLGGMVSNFLKLRPWAPEKERGQQVSWKIYITKGFTARRGGSTTVVRQILERLVIRHTAEDVEKCVALPPLYHKQVHLNPGYYEKLAMNIFLAQLAVNAVTSERKDQDYMFHPKNKGQLIRLVNNLLKQSGFYWTGHARADIEQTASIAMKHLQRRKNYSPEDMELLRRSVASLLQAIHSPRWNEITTTHEMGYFISDLPTDCIESWSFSENSCRGGDAPMFGAAPVLEMQKYIYENSYLEDLIRELHEEGIAFGQKHREAIERENSKTAKRNSKAAAENERRGVSGSSMSAKAVIRTAAKSQRPDLEIISSKPANKKNAPRKEYGSPAKPLKSAMKQTSSQQGLLPPDSPLVKTMLLGTTSTKLSYLLSAILRHHTTEKILVFYESDDVAMYIAQGLEILGIEYLAYAKSLKGTQKAQYIVAFHDTDRFRVLLMDLSQAAHGLNVCSASRVYFVNAVWTPSVEAQALKRAHRIGQTRPVYAESLVLSGTLEEEMIKRRNAMSHRELKETHDNVVNDSGMRGIITKLGFLDVENGEGFGPRQVARMEAPQPIFGREQRGGINRENDDLLAIAAADVTSNDQGKRDPPRISRKKVVMRSPVSIVNLRTVEMIEGHSSPTINPRTRFTSPIQAMELDHDDAASSSSRSSICGPEATKRKARFALDEVEEVKPAPKKKKKGVSFA